MVMSRAKRAGKAGFNGLATSACGVHLVGDVPERLCRWGIPPYLDKKRKRALARIRERGILFIHVPKNAGTSICQSLYGMQTMHHSAVYYAKVAPDVLDLPSFAVVRDPAERFLSAFRYARAGGTADRKVAPPFRRKYSRFQGVDDAIVHLEQARNIYDLDYLFRPQAWFLQDATGKPAIDHLVPYSRIDSIAALPGIDGLDDIPRLNASRPGGMELDCRQRSFIREYFAEDYRLLDRARSSMAAGSGK